MNEIAAYKVISVYGTEQLKKEVNLAINEGWYPIGGVAFGTIVMNKDTEQTGNVFS
jgi:hypothetical protein